MTESTSFFSRSWAALLVLSVAAIGSALLGGCAREDYYCDNSGCYYCDGVGCRNVNAPTRAPCRGDYQCAAGQACTTLGCATSCTADAECPRGTICAPPDATGQRLCRAPAEGPLTRAPGSCSTAADCATGVCLNGICQASTTPRCNTDAECSGGNVCIEHVCTARTNTCQFSNQCGAGRVCVNSECRLACASVTCPTGQMCSAEGYCVTTTTAACVLDSQCASGQHCFNGTCLQACTPSAGSTSCGSTELYCSDDGVCVPDTRPRPFCTSDAGCASGSSCVNGVCRLPCATDVECQRHDVTYRNCGHIPNQPTITPTYCLTDNETSPVCARQADCTAGRSCLDGQCR